MNGGALGCFLKYRKDQRSPMVHHSPGCPLTLAYTELQDEEGKSRIKLFISSPGNSLEMEGPSSTRFDWRGETITRPNIITFFNPKSWLIFHRLVLQGSQNWLVTPYSMWYLFSDYRKLEEFSVNLLMTNDLAKRGVALISNLSRSNDKHFSR